MSVATFAPQFPKTIAPFRLPQMPKLSPQAMIKSAISGVKSGATVAGGAVIVGKGLATWGLSSTGLDYAGAAVAGAYTLGKNGVSAYRDFDNNASWKTKVRAAVSNAISKESRIEATVSAGTAFAAISAVGFVADTAVGHKIGEMAGNAFGNALAFVSGSGSAHAEFKTGLGDTLTTTDGTEVNRDSNSPSDEELLGTPTSQVDPNAYPFDAGQPVDQTLTDEALLPDLNDAAPSDQDVLNNMFSGSAPDVETTIETAEPAPAPAPAPIQPSADYPFTEIQQGPEQVFTSNGEPLFGSDTNGDGIKPFIGLENQVDYDIDVIPTYEIPAGGSLALAAHEVYNIPFANEKAIGDRVAAIAVYNNIPLASINYVLEGQILNMPAPDMYADINLSKNEMTFDPSTPLDQYWEGNATLGASETISIEQAFELVPEPRTDCDAGDFWAGDHSDSCSTLISREGWADFGGDIKTGFGIATQFLADNIGPVPDTTPAPDPTKVPGSIIVGDGNLMSADYGPTGTTADMKPVNSGLMVDAPAPQAVSNNDALSGMFAGGELPTLEATPEVTSTDLVIPKGSDISTVAIAHYGLDKTSPDYSDQIQHVLSLVFSAPENEFVDTWELNGVRGGTVVTFPDISEEPRVKISLSDLARDTNDGSGPSKMYQNARMAPSLGM